MSHCNPLVAYVIRSHVTFHNKLLDGDLRNEVAFVRLEWANYEFVCMTSELLKDEWDSENGSGQWCVARVKLHSSQYYLRSFSWFITIWVERDNASFIGYVLNYANIPSLVMKFLHFCQKYWFLINIMLNSNEPAKASVKFYKFKCLVGGWCTGNRQLTFGRKYFWAVNIPFASWDGGWHLIWNNYHQ